MKTLDIYKDESTFMMTMLAVGSLLYDTSAFNTLSRLLINEHKIIDILDGKYYFIMTVDIIDADFTQVRLHKKNYSDKPMDYRTISFAIADSLDSYASLYPFSVNGTCGLLGVINESDNTIKKFTPKEGGTFLLNTLSNVREKIFRQSGIDLSILIGELIERNDSLKLEFSRMESSDPEEFNANTTYDKVRFIREQDRRPITHNYLVAKEIPQMELALAKAAAAHNFRKVSELFIQISKIEQSIFPAKRNMIQKSIDRLSMVYSFSGIPPFIPDNPNISFYSWITAIRNAVTINDVIDIIQTTIYSMHEYSQAECINDSVVRIEEIIDFINKKYTDPTLCTTVICEKFDINISTFSRQFKDQTGMKFIDYLHKLRIDHAKKMLTDDLEIKMDTIAETIGYTNIITFFRAFKRLQGITPGTYRLEYIQALN